MCAGVIALARVSHNVQQASNIHLDLKFVMLAWLWPLGSSQPGHGDGITGARKQYKACELKKDKNNTLLRVVSGKEFLIKSPVTAIKLLRSFEGL